MNGNTFNVYYCIKSQINPFCSFVNLIKGFHQFNVNIMKNKKDSIDFTNQRSPKYYSKLIDL